MAIPLLFKDRMAKKLIPIALTAILAVVGVLVLLVLFLVPAASSKSGNAASALSCSTGTGGTLNGADVPDEYEEAINASSAANGISAPILAAQLAKESNWNPKAVSPAGARGLAQFMPGTWATWGNGKDPFDPYANIEAQGAFMGELLKLMTQYVAEGKVTAGQDPIALALAAYNAGPGNVSKYSGIPPFAETQRYVTAILDGAQTTYGSGCTDTGGGVSVGPGEWTHPLPGAVLTSGYGQRWGTLHAGIDLSVPGSGAGPVLAAADMQVTRAGCTSDGYGCSVVGIGADGLQFRYGHMADGSLLVNPGQTITAGTRLGTEGATGFVTGVHLHFEIYAAGAPENAYASSGKSADPIPYLQAKGIQV